MKREYYTVMRNRVLASYHHLNITNEEMMLLIHFLSFQQEGEDFPAIPTIANRMNLMDTQLYEMIQSLIEKGCLSIPSYKNAEGKAIEYYSLDPLYQRLDRLEEAEKDERFKEAKATQEGEVFEMIQIEFGRQLSPIEYQQISEWFTKDQYDPDVIKEAIKEAVLNQAFSLKYIDRILMNWAKNKQTKANDQPRNQQVNSGNQRSTGGGLPPVPTKKWLNLNND